MTPMKSSVRNVSPRPKSSRYKEVTEEKLHVNRVREIISEWPEGLQDLLYDIESEVNDNNELLNIFNHLLELKSKVDANYSKEYSRHVVQCLDYLEANAQYVRGDQVFIPECANVSELSINISANTSKSYLPNGSLVALLVLAGCIYISFSNILYIFSSNTPDNTGVGPNMKEWAENIKDLQKNFPSQNEKIWYSIMSGVKTIVTEKPTKPSVLLLLHNDKKTSACLANQVGKKAVKLLSGNKQSQEPIIIQGEDLKLNDSLSEDYGLFTETYKHEIENIHVMIVHDLQEVPATIARAFHVLCDVENPLVRNAAFLFTMQVDEKEKKPTKIAEEYLVRLWEGKLSNDIMDPLITRITDAVESVEMESSLPKCCFETIHSQLQG